jgi:hypothetical protein
LAAVLVEQEDLPVLGLAERVREDWDQALVEVAPVRVAPVAWAHQESVGSKLRESEALAVVAQLE